MATFHHYPHVFSHYAIGNMELKNRLVFSSVVSGHATIRDGDVTENLIDFVGACARTGVARVTIGASPVDLGRARDGFASLSVTRETDITGVRSLAEEVHRYDTKLSIELMHAGSTAQTEALGGRKAYVPWLTPEMDPDVFMEIGEHEMNSIVALFRNGARRCAEGNCDEVMIQCAHGGLLNSFLSPATNQRNDQYGGSFENRIRFPLRVLREVREEIGNRLNIEVRISQNEYAKGTVTLNEIIDFLNEASLFVDSACLSGGWLHHPNWVRKLLPSYCEPRCLNRERTAIIRKSVNLPIVTVGNIISIDAAENLLTSDVADVVAMTRSLLADMNMVRKAYSGAESSIRPCLRCVECTSRLIYGGEVRCAVNPQLGRETKYSSIGKADKKKKVLIIGGGPAGMQAAQIATMRGHDVVLYEKEGVLGGRLKEASMMYKKVDTHRRYMEWAIAETMNCGARIVLNTEVTPKIATMEMPDVIINASGGIERWPSIPGIDNPKVISITAADRKLAPVGHRVVVMGGGISGLEAAIQLAHESHVVTLIDKEPMDKLWREVRDELRSGLIELMEEHNIKLIDEATIYNIGNEGIEYRLGSGQLGCAPGDTYIAAFGIVKNTDFNLAIEAVIPDVRLVGDARLPDSIFGANMDGFNVAIEV
ncbi:MAG: FAD-dependent oxidoreductase [Actinomycetia bacterium]|nr:FAD-dependent oxidoreductase [Actinomycetes bacterium]